MKLVVAMAGILVMTVILTVIKIYNLDMADTADHTALRVLGLLCTIPLILIVILDWGWKRIYDERDMYIERQSLIIGVIAAFFFLAGAALLLLVIRPLGSFNIYFLPSLVYLAYFAFLSSSSVAALVQYGRCVKNGENLNKKIEKLIY